MAGRTGLYLAAGLRAAAAAVFTGIEARYLELTFKSPVCLFKGDLDGGLKVGAAPRRVRV